MTNIRLPNITGTTDKEKIEQIRMYLVKTIEELNQVLTAIDKSIVSASDEFLKKTEFEKINKENRKAIRVLQNKVKALETQ